MVYDCNKCKHLDTDECNGCSNLSGDRHCACHLNPPCGFCENLKYEE